MEDFFLKVAVIMVLVIVGPMFRRWLGIERTLDQRFCDWLKGLFGRQQLRGEAQPPRSQT
jgi:hypothetical protein